VERLRNLERVGFERKRRSLREEDRNGRSRAGNLERGRLARKGRRYEGGRGGRNGQSRVRKWGEG
jgi:hypothetical protein